MMNEKQAEMMLKSIKRMEQLLEAIDWKLWNFHQRVIGDGDTSSQPVDEETEQLAGIVEKTPTPVPAKVAVEKKLGFPSVEKWS